MAISEENEPVAEPTNWVRPQDLSGSPAKRRFDARLRGATPILCASLFGFMAPLSSARTDSRASLNGTIASILENFERVNVVAIGTSLDRRQDLEFAAAIVSHAAFATYVDVIVVDFGNASYQGEVDPFVRGEARDIETLRPAIRDALPVGAWDSPAYLEFFQIVRDANAARDAGSEVGVVLGGVPVDWDEVRDFEDLSRIADRDDHLAEVIEEMALERSKRVLVLARQERVTPLDHAGRIRESPSALARLRSNSGLDTFVAWVIPPGPTLGRMLGFVGAPPFIETTRDTKIGRIRTSDVLLVEERADEFRWPLLHTVGDALLYLGDNARRFRADLSSYRDPLTVQELVRRAEIADRQGTFDEGVEAVEVKIQMAAVVSDATTRSSSVAEANGLAYSIELESPVVRSGESVLVECAWTNVSSQPLTIETGEHFWGSGFTVTKNGRLLSHKKFGVGCGSAPVRHLLKPGETLRNSQEISLDFDLGKPGVYRIGGPFRNYSSSDGTDAAWSGVIYPERIELTVLPKDARK